MVDKNLYSPHDRKQWYYYYFSGTVFASRSFSVAAPTVWNSLPDNVEHLSNCWKKSASEMTYIVSGGALNSTHSLTQLLKSDWKLTFSLRHAKRSCHKAPLHFLILM